MNYKKIGIIVAFVLLVAVIGYFLFVFFFKPTMAPITGPETPATGEFGGLPEAGSGTGTPTSTVSGELPDAGSSGSGQVQAPLTPTVEDASVDIGAVASAALSANGQMRFYNESDGKFYTLGADGKAITLSDRRFAGAESIIWSDTSNKAIIEFPDGSKVRYNFDTEEQVTLPKHWEDFAFSPDGNKIVSKSIGVDPDNRWLIISNDDGSQAKQIEALGENGDDVISSWSPNNQSVAMYAESIDSNRKEIFFIGQNGENFKSIITEGRGFQPKWSPAGNELLYSVYSADNDYKPSLWLVNAQGDTIGNSRRPLGLNTWAEKCGFGDGSMFCAVPQSLERGAGLYPSLSEGTPDYLYKINPQTGTKELVNLGGGSYSMKNLTVSPDGSYLFFTDSSTGRLKKIKLR